MRKLLVLSPLLFGGLIAYFLIVSLYTDDTNYEELALGKQTVSHFASVDGVPIHIQGARNFELLKKGLKENAGKKVILLLGNSQTHSINQMNDGETTYPALLHEGLANTEYTVVASSLPNANLQELYLTLDFLSSQLPVTHVAIPVFMDDLREDGIRNDLIQDIKSVSPSFHVYPESPLAVKLNSELGKGDSKSESAVSTGNSLSPQDISEARLNSWLENHSTIWRKRANVRGDLFNRLYFFRNWVFGINAQSKRKLIKDRYVSNFQALDAMLMLCKERKIKPVVYIPPIRYDVEIPYDTKEYETFKNDLESLAGKYSYKIHNLEHVVPNAYWGTKASTTGKAEGEIDFMHFQYKGHQILAEKLKEQVL